MTDSLEIQDLPPLAAVIYPRDCQVDALIAEVVSDPTARGIRVAGGVQASQAGPVGGCATVVVRDVLDQSVVAISENCGPAARGCKLDPRGLAEVAAKLEAILDTHPGLLVISRFGKAEIEGGGLRSVFTEALLRGVPVLTAVRESNAQDWRNFHLGAARDLPPTRPAPDEWVEEWQSRSKGMRAA